MIKNARRVAGLSTAAVLTAGAVTVATVVPAYADIERQGRVSGAHYDFSVDRERGGFEVSFDLDNAAPGSRWVVRMSHDGKRYFNRTVTARADDDDRDGEFEIERWRGNTAGKDVFRVSIRKVGTSTTKVVKITTR